jgi:hypothetical protein
MRFKFIEADQIKYFNENFPSKVSPDEGKVNDGLESPFCIFILECRVLDSAVRQRRFIGIHARIDHRGQ